MTESSLSRSLLRWLLWPLVPILVGGAVVAFQLAWTASQDAFDLALMDTAFDLSRQVRIVDGKPALDLPLAAQQMLATSNEDKVYYAVRTEAGDLVAGEPELPVRVVPGADSRQQFYGATVGGAPVRAIALRAEPEAGRGRVDIAVAQTLKTRNHTFASIFAGLLGPEILLVVASLTVVRFGIRRGLAPAERLRSEIVSRSPQDLRPIDEAMAPAELRPVLRALNELLGRLDAALGSQRQFVADAAHQLRTPLAVLRARIELASAKADGEFAETLAELLAGTERTTRLANQLLLLARAEQIETAADMSGPVELKQLVAECVDDWLLRADRQGVELAFELADVGVRGNAFLIREMLGNLVDNAIRYTPAGGTVTVRTRRDGGTTIAEIEDTGPGIAAEYRDKVRQRFFRIPGTQIEGCGLGLAIVEEIAHAHGAALCLRERRGGGLVAAIEFPAAP